MINSTPNPISTPQLIPAFRGDEIAGIKIKQPSNAITEKVSSFARQLFQMPDKYVTLSNGQNQDLKLRVKDLAKTLGVSNQEIVSAARSGKLDQLIQIKVKEKISTFIESQKTPLEQKYSVKNQAVVRQRMTENIERVANFVGGLNFLKSIESNGKTDITMMQTMKAIGNDLKNVKAGTTYHKASMKSGSAYFDSDKIKIDTPRYGYAIKNGEIIVSTPELVGEGGFKKVKNAIFLNNAKKFVKATIKENSTKNAISDFQKEKQMINTLHDKKIPHIMARYQMSYSKDWKAKEKTSAEGAAIKANASEKSQKAYGYVEKYDGSVNSLAGSASPKDLLLIFSNMSETLTKMHENNIVHHDFKPENILYKKDEKGKLTDAVLSDFGTTSDTSTVAQNGTHRYLPPEILSENVGAKSDVAKTSTDSYALGVSIVEMVTGQARPKESYFNSIPADQLKGTIEKQWAKKTELLYVSEEDSVVEKKMLDVALKLLDPNPDTRMTCKQAFAEIQDIKKSLK